MARRGAGSSPLWTVRVLRLLRYALYLSIIGMIWWLTTEFAFVRLEPGDASVANISGMHRLLVDRIDSDERFESGTVLVFAILDDTDQQIFRASRVFAAPGDRVETVDGYYAVNGEKSSTTSAGIAGLEGVLPEGRYFVLNDTTLSEYADSRRLGWIPRECIIGRFLTELPF